LGYDGRMVFRPVSMLYLFMLLLSLFSVISIVFLLLGDLLVSVLGIPAQWVGIFLFVSLFGSFVNIPAATLESKVPIVRVREVNAFGVKWQVPRVSVGVTRTQIMINVGGAVLPIIVSGYLLGMPLIQASGNAVDEYLAIATVLVIVSVFVNKSARVIEGLGVATPALAPPLVTVLATILVDFINTLHSPVQVAYIGGDLGYPHWGGFLNLNRVRDMGAPVVSIGGAGTFDGIYLTGIVSVLLVFLTLG
jgi:uncharacterized membrane protein